MEHIFLFIYVVIYFFIYFLIYLFYLCIYLFIYLFILPNVGFRESNYIKMFNHGGMTMNHTKYVVSEWGMPPKCQSNTEHDTPWDFGMTQFQEGFQHKLRAPAQARRRESSALAPVPDGK